MLSAFKAHLAKRALVKDKYIPYYLKWVTDCYSFLDKPNSEVLNGDAKQRFLRQLAKTHEDW